MSTTKYTLRNEGQRLLTLVGRSHTEIGAASKVTSKQTVSHWLNGTKTPGPEKRLALSAAFGIPVETWDRAPTSTPARNSVPTPRKLSAKRAPQTLPNGPPNTLAEIDALLAAVRALRAPGLSQAETLKLVKEERSLLREKARVKEREDLREDSIVRSHPGWHRLRDRMLACLAKHPEALADLLRTLEAEQAKP